MSHTHAPALHALVAAARTDLPARGFGADLRSSSGGHDLSRIAVSAPRRPPSAFGPIQRVILKSDGTPYKRLNPSTGTWSGLHATEKAHLQALHDDPHNSYTIDEAHDEARSRALTSGGPTKKRKVAPYTFDPTTDYSDSEDEAIQQGNPFAKKWGAAGKKEVFNYTKHGRGAYRSTGKKKGMRPKIDNKVHPDDVQDARDALEQDAEEIHDLIPATDSSGRANRSHGATTITTSLMEDVNTGMYKRYAHINTELMPPELREEAEDRGYHVVKAQKSHAEGEKIQFDTAREGVLEHDDMGVDKEHCAECEWAMGEKYGSGVQTETGYSGKTFKKWHNPEALQEALGLSSAATPTRDKSGNLKKRKKPSS